MSFRRRHRWFAGAWVAVFALAVLPAAEKKGKAAKQGPSGPARWEETIRKFESADRAKPPAQGGVLLVGGSNARRWTDVSDYFPPHAVINRGFGGAHLTDVLHFADRIVLPYAPKVILLNAGGNDLSAGKSPAAIRAAGQAFAEKIRAALPGTRIYTLSLPPVLRAARVPNGLDTIRNMNAQLAGLAREEPNMEFIDLFTAFLDAQGQPRPELFVADGTHFSPQGYAVVAGLLRGKF